MLPTASIALLAAILPAVLAAPASTTIDSHPLIGKRDVTFDGRTFVNKGLVGFGRIGASAVDSYGETLGGLGSSIFLQSLDAPRNDGTLSGLLRLNPDRGHNTVTTTDYRARSHLFRFTFDPAKGSDAQTENVALQYQSSTLFRTTPALNFTTGLDALGVRGKTPLTPSLPIAPSDNHVSFDVEGWAPSNVGTISFLSDEYGPYIHTVESATGVVLASTAPPAAILPYVDGQLNFTSTTNPDTGRAPNQGFEGLTFDRATGTLWALLQSATVQDSDNGSKTSNRYTRLLGFDARNPLQPRLTSEFVVPLPRSASSGKTYAQSELHVVDRTTFLVLARDGNGFGDSNPSSKYKQVDLISTKGATNIAGTKYDAPANPITVNKGAALQPDITPTAYAPFVDLLNAAQLAKFGLHNGGAIDRTLIASKLESLAVANLRDSQDRATGDQLLFVVSDNDFITANGHQAAQVADGSYQLQPYADEYAVTSKVDGDTQVFIYRVTLPGYDQGAQPN